MITLSNINKTYYLRTDKPLLAKELFFPQAGQKIQALNHINLKITKGETIGILGQNGSGKSTLLKVIAGITTPTSGKLQVSGRIASLIELGSGFHHDLTGLENLYIHAALLGLNKDQTTDALADIITFADIGKFINQPVRMYSSGMIIRLSFSIAIHVKPEILLIDEVLAVGDQFFQQKCFDKIRELQTQKITIIYVSHVLHTVKAFCTRTIIMKKGRITHDGKTNKMLQIYQSQL